MILEALNKADSTEHDKGRNLTDIVLGKLSYLGVTGNDLIDNFFEVRAVLCKANHAGNIGKIPATAEVIKVEDGDLVPILEEVGHTEIRMDEAVTGRVFSIGLNAVTHKGNALVNGGFFFVTQEFTLLIMFAIVVVPARTESAVPVPGDTGEVLGSLPLAGCNVEFCGNFAEELIEMAVIGVKSTLGRHDAVEAVIGTTGYTEQRKRNGIGDLAECCHNLAEALGVVCRVSRSFTCSKGETYHIPMLIHFRGVNGHDILAGFGGNRSSKIEIRVFTEVIDKGKLGTDRILLCIIHAMDSHDELVIALVGDEIRCILRDVEKFKLGVIRIAPQGKSPLGDVKEMGFLLLKGKRSKINCFRNSSTHSKNLLIKQKTAPLPVGRKGGFAKSKIRYYYKENSL